MKCFIAILIFLSLLIPFKGVYGYGVEDPPVHQHIAKEALQLWKDIPQEILDHAANPVDVPLCEQCFPKYSEGKDIISGSGEEDKEINPLPWWAFGAGCYPGEVGHEYCPGDATEGRNGFMEHFWNPDRPNLGHYNCDSSFKGIIGGYNGGMVLDLTPAVENPKNGRYDSAYRLAKDYWENKVMFYYKKGNKAEAYYWLGRIAHLLTDLTVPAHVHGLPHDPFIGGTDWFEGYFTPLLPNRIFHYKGQTLRDQGQTEYRFEDLPNMSNFRWDEVHPNPSNLFKLFWYTAQKTQYFASKSRTLFRGLWVKKDGNDLYNKYFDSTDFIFSPFLWNGEKDYKGNPVTPITSYGQVPTHVQEIADALIPHAMRAVAGLYRLFWLETRVANEEWVRRYNGPANGWDDPTAIAVDGQGNVYVTGYSEGSGTGFDYATIKYDTNGNQKWVRRYNGPGNDEDLATAIAVDGQGNVYVTGYSKWSDTVSDYATIKYDTNGNQKWVRRYHGPGNFLDWARAVAVDGQGNVYVTGGSYGSGTGIDYATIKYDANGNQKWVRRYNGPGNSTDWATAMAVDGQGNVYVTGYSEGSGTDWDYATIKYDTNGNRKWVRRYDGPANGWDDPCAMAVDGQGNVYVTGSSIGSGTSFDYATIKYDANGNQKWVRRYNGLGNDHDRANAIAVDGQGNVYVTGESKGSGTSWEYATIKYDTDGNQKWVRRYNGPGNYCYAIAVDGQGNVYVTGESIGSAGTVMDYATIKYDANGTQKWVRRYNGPGNGWDRASAIAMDGQGNVYVTGYSKGSGTGYDYATIKYSQK